MIPTLVSCFLLRLTITTLSGSLHGSVIEWSKVPADLQVDYKVPLQPSAKDDTAKTENSDALYTETTEPISILTIRDGTMACNMWRSLYNKVLIALRSRPTLLNRSRSTASRSQITESSPPPENRRPFGPTGSSRRGDLISLPGPAAGERSQDLSVPAQGPLRTSTSLKGSKKDPTAERAMSVREQLSRYDTVTMDLSKSPERRQNSIQKQQAATRTGGSGDTPRISRAKASNTKDKEKV